MTNTQDFLDDIKEEIKDFIIANSTYVAVGTSATAATPAQTSLLAETNRKARQEYTEGTSDVVVSLFLGTTDDNGEDLTEVGVLNASSVGDMMMRATYPAISKTVSIDLWIDVEEQVDVVQ